MAKILIVDDDNQLTWALVGFLSIQGHTVEAAASGEDALQLLSSYKYDLIVIDWGLPGINGDELCRSFRHSGGQTPIMFLTGKNNVSFLETAFDSGGDDYMMKPFDIRELSARIKGLLRRPADQYVAELRIGGLLLIADKRTACANGKEVRLRAKESALLEFLMRHPNKVYNAQNLLDAVWKADSNGTAHSVRTWMATLRQQLATIGEEALVKTIPGFGYTIESKPDNMPDEHKK